MNLKYEQPNMDKIVKEYERLLQDFINTTNEKEQLDIIERINQIRDNFFSMYWLSYINYLLDVNNTYWNKQEKFFAKNDPIMNNLKLKYYQALNNSQFKDSIKRVIGDKVFKIAKEEVKLISDDINNELQKEKELSNAYSKIMASAKVIFDGQELSLTQLGKYLLSNDRNIRIEANKVRIEFMESVEAKIDEIMDELIKVRTRMAQKLGLKSYTDMSYIKMRRLDYNKHDVEVFRNEVLKYVVPLVQKLKERQRKELSLDKLIYYDDPILFKDGNAIPRGNTRWIVEQATKMYKSISPKLYELFKKMTIEGLMDLDSRPGKSGGGITTYIPNYKVPIFISNFNGTSHDIQVLTHEFGHCFQLYSSKDLKYYENWWPTYDTCEIHSISMELLTLPYMDMFFREDKEKYVYEKLFSIFNNMCYICLVDEFQHIIYDDPNLTINERKMKWRELEKKYMPWLNFDSCDYLERGNTWHKQSHIFCNPFYYIDYALADSIALQFYFESLENPNEIWQKYIDFCSWGGTYTFVESIKRISFKSPFIPGLLEKLVKDCEKNL